jgi:exodeoxyribonuclease V alpha subunit
MSNTLDHIRASITRFIWQGEGGFKIAMAMYESPTGLTPQKVSGTFPHLAEVNEWFSLEGNFVADKGRNGERGGEMFRARKIRPDLPVTMRGAMELLDKTFNWTTHGISSDAISSFVKRHGDTAALVAEDKPEILLEMQRNTAYHDVILEAWAKRISARKPLRFLKDANVSEDATNAIVRYHKDLALDAIKADPYGLIRINGVSFEDVDKIGRHLGIPEDDIRRISAGLLDCIATAESGGNTVVELESLEDEISRRKLTMPHLAKFAMSRLSAQQTGVAFEAAGKEVVIQSFNFHRMETFIAAKMVKMLKDSMENNDNERFDAVVNKVLASNPNYARFDEIQKEAVRLCVRNPIAILTGGPGTGKSTVTEAIVESLAELGIGVIHPMAPTGKAAVRLKETTKLDVLTIHSSLQATGEDGDGGFGRNASNPYPEGSIIIIDEASMIDTKVFYSLLQAIQKGSRILLVGDRWQLPSVGPGAILSDLLTTVAANGARIPSAELKNIYRSSKDSGIATGAVEVRNGSFDIGRIDNTGRSGVSFYEVRRNEIVKMTIDLVRKLRDPKEGLGLDPKRDLGILCPQHEKIGGTLDLNRALQQELNPKGAEVGFLAAIFRDNPKKGPAPRIGDRVMLTKNIHAKKVANGDVGIIVQANEGNRTTKPPIKGQVTVEFESGAVVRFTEAESRDLVVAYAITGHKSQGSQYPAVIMPMSTDFSPTMLYRSLTYTMWTRAKNHLFIVGEAQAFNMSMENTKPSRRSTRLRHHLAKLLNDQIKPSKDMLNCNVDMVDYSVQTGKATQRPAAPVATAPRPIAPPSARPPAMRPPGMRPPVPVPAKQAPPPVAAQTPPRSVSPPMRSPAFRPPPMTRPPVANPMSAKPTVTPLATVATSQMPTAPARSLPPIPPRPPIRAPRPMAVAASVPDEADGQFATGPKF